MIFEYSKGENTCQRHRVWSEQREGVCLMAITEKQLRILKANNEESHLETRAQFDPAFILAVSMAGKPFVEIISIGNAVFPSVLLFCQGSKLFIYFRFFQSVTSSNWKFSSQLFSHHDSGTVVCLIYHHTISETISEITIYLLSWVSFAKAELSFQYLFTMLFVQLCHGCQRRYLHGANIHAGQ